MALYAILISAALLVTAAPPTLAQLADPSQLFQWHVDTTVQRVGAGDTLHIEARLRIAENHHVYEDWTSVWTDPVDGLWVGEATSSPPTVKYDKFEDKDVAMFIDQAVYRLPIVADTSLVGSEVEATLYGRTRGCSDDLCYFPTSDTMKFTIRVDDGARAGGAGAGYAELNRAPTDVTDVGKAMLEGGIMLALGLMFVGGVLTSFTPCVYPLIPITVSFFGATKTTRVRSFLLSVVFVLGMATMYSALGVTAAATGAVFGTIMTNPIVIGLIAAVFLAFAASMFGAFKIQLPAALQMRLQSVGGTGAGGAFVAGMVAGVIAAPCTGPVLGSALAYVATTGDLSFGFLSMFAFASGMGLLFMAIGTFSASIVPKSGPWLAKIESVFGIVMVAVALYFLKDILPLLKDVMVPGTEALLVSLGLVAVAIAIGAIRLSFVAGFDAEGNLLPAPTLSQRLRKGAGIILAVIGLYGAVGSFMAPPVASVGGDHAEPNWVYDESEGLALARSLGKPVLIDAYADWCAACIELDRHTYPDPDVLKRLEDFVAIKLDFTTTTAATRATAAKYAITGLPTVIILDSDGNELSERRMLGFFPPEEFLQVIAGVR
jgi:thioredoxin:protein disulfide reductase